MQTTCDWDPATGFGPGLPAATRRLWWRADAAARLGARPVGLMLWHRAVERRRARRLLADAVAPSGPFLIDLAPAVVAPRDWHHPFPSDAHALALDLFAPGDIRPVWEAGRWAELPRLALAARTDRDALGRAEALLADWAAANPPFRGPHWACGQEAALRVLHLGLALLMLGSSAPRPGTRALLALHARRIAAAPAYALAQDNNHPVSEAAGLYACGLLLADDALAARAARRLGRVVARLVAADGGFAPCSTGYLRLLLDVLAVTELLRRQHQGPPLPPVVASRAAAAAALLYRMTDPITGAVPRIGHQDGSAFADLSQAGPDDARPSIERAALVFTGRSAGFGADPGCLALGLYPQRPGAAFTRPAQWQAQGLAGWRQGGVHAVLRRGPLRFRPQQADLLHVDLWQGSRALLRDGGTGAYNPGPDAALAGFADAAAHNGIMFDGQEPMPAVTRFLFAGWPRCGALPDGGWLRDRHGNCHSRRLRQQGPDWIITDDVSGRFRRLVLRWRLLPGAWTLREDGVDGPAQLRIAADTRFTCRLTTGRESLRYGQTSPVPVLEVEAAAPVSHLTTRVRLHDA